MKRKGVAMSSKPVAAGSVGVAVVLLSVWAGTVEVHAERLPNQVAVFAALDKVTARISKLEVRLNQTVRFGSLKVTPRVCYTRSPTEPPKTSTFVEVDEVQLDGQEKRLFVGWMFAESPGLNAVEHPVFDVWLTSCSASQRSEDASKDGKESQPKQEPDPDATRRRVRR